MTVPIRLVTTMLSHMVSLADEIRRLERNFAAERLRGHRHTSN